MLSEPQLHIDFEREMCSFFYLGLGYVANVFF